MKEGPLDLDRLRDQLAQLDGEPPYDDPDNNEHLDDGFFAIAIEQEWGMPLDALREIVRAQRTSNG